MTKSLAFTLLLVALTCPYFSQEDPAYDCQDPASCEMFVEFDFTLGANEEASMDFTFSGSISGGGILLDWPGGGSSYPSDLSLSLCSPNGECVAVAGYGGSLPGETIGGWPSTWDNVVPGTYVACFSFADLSLSGSGLWTLTGLNSYSSSADDIAFGGIVDLFMDCIPMPDSCANEAACNFGVLEACTYPGCNDPEACNYDETAGCDDGSCEYEQHIFVPNNEATLGGPVIVWCGPIPDCSNPTIGCPIPGGHLELTHPCAELVLENLGSCAASWTTTCALEFLLCTQYTLGCTNEAACNYDPDAGYDDNSCIFPGSPCDDGDECTTDDSLNLQCECEGQTGDADGDGLCGGEDCDDSNPGLPDALGRCDLPVAGCSNEEALNYSPETGEETACILPGGCGEPLIAPDWAHGFTGWMAPENWSFSHVELAALDNRALVLHSPNNGVADTAKASITAPANLLIEFTFSYHSADAAPVFDPPMVLINGEVKQVMDYMINTPPPGQALDETAGWFHNQTIMPSPDVAPDPALLPPEHLLPMGLLIDDALTWDYPYQMPVAFEVDSGDVMTIAMATSDGLANSAAMAVTALTRQRYCPGCEEVGACNFDPLATHGDGSCDYSCYGCMDEGACDYDPQATLPIDSCDYSCLGCMDTNACNYDADASIEDGTCEYCSCGITPGVVATGGVDQDGVNVANATLLATDGGIAQCSLRDTTVLLFGIDDGPFIDLDGSADHVLALSVDSILYAYGRNDVGQASVPQDLPKPIAFSAGQTHSVAVDAEGEAYGWGDGGLGQLDLGANQNLVGIEAGQYHTLGWNADGEVVLAVGSNDFGQLNVPEGLVVQKVSSSLHNMALTPDGGVVCWGYNEYGQCDVPEFTQPVVDVAASKRSSLALLEDGSLVIWGRLNHIEPIDSAVAISGNMTEDYFAILNQDGRIHHLMVQWFMSIQGPSGSALVEARPNCTDWCVDLDLDGVCDLRDDCIGTLTDCGCECLNDANQNGTCDELEVRGCMDPEALNFNHRATIFGPCRYTVLAPFHSNQIEACNFDPDSAANWISEYEESNPDDFLNPAEIADEYLEYSSCGGCMDPHGCNFNPEATWEDGSCEYTTCIGCADPLACNYNPKVAATDSCNYCGCHWTVPLVDAHNTSILTINSMGEAELRTNASINISPRFGQAIEGVMRRNGVREGACGPNSAILIMEDGSLQEMAGLDEEARLRIQYAEEFETEAELGVDLHVRLIDGETTLPNGTDFTQVAAGGNGSLALRTDGSVEVWGSDMAYIGDWAQNGRGSNELNLLEWARSLENITQIETSDLGQGALALDANGVLHAYSPKWIYEGIPDGFEDDIALMKCDHLGRCVLVHEDGSHAYMFAEGDYVGENFEPLEVPYWALAVGLNTLLELGMPVELSFTVGAVSAARYDDGDVAIAGSTDENPFVTVLEASSFSSMGISQGISYATVLDSSGQLIRHDYNAAEERFIPAYPMEASNEIPEPDAFISEFPRRMLLGPPTDCQGCPDMDGDGICDAVDNCDGEEDALGVCGGDCLGDFDHDGECDLFDRPGCTYVEACTYLEEATWDDGSCIFSMIPTDADFSGLGGGCPTDLDGSGTVATADLLLLLAAFGEECEQGELDFFDPCTDEIPFDCGTPYTFHGVDYPTVEIGALCWFQTNLASPLFANGQPLEVTENLAQWEAAQGSMAAHPGWDSALTETYGLLYNAMSINDPRGLCPWGWHVSTDAEWMDTEIATGMSLEEAVSLGNRGVSDNIASRFKDNSPLWGFAGGGNNISGFTALPAGRIDHLGNNNSQGASAWFWAAPPLDTGERALRSMSSGNGGVFRDFDNTSQGFSVRCVKD